MAMDAAQKRLLKTRWQLSPNLVVHNNACTAYKNVQRIESSPDAPLSRRSHAVTQINGKVYIFGGIAVDGLRKNDLYELHFSGNKWVWTNITPRAEVVPRGRAGHSLNASRSPRCSIWLFGGYSEFGALGDIWEYIFNTSSWKEVQPINGGPTPRCGHSAILRESGEPTAALYIFGGRTDSGVETLNSRRETLKVECRQGQCLSDLWRFDLSLGRWTSIDTINTPSPRWQQCGTLWTDQILVFGGRGGFEDRPLDDVWQLNISKSRWYQMATSGVPPLAEEVLWWPINVLIGDRWLLCQDHELDLSRQAFVTSIGSCVAQESLRESRKRESTQRVSSMVNCLGAIQPCGELIVYRPRPQVQQPQMDVIESSKSWWESTVDKVVDLLDPYTLRPDLDENLELQCTKDSVVSSQRNTRTPRMTALVSESQSNNEDKTAFGHKHAHNRNKSNSASSTRAQIWGGAQAQHIGRRNLSSVDHAFTPSWNPDSPSISSSTVRSVSESEKVLDDRIEQNQQRLYDRAANHGTARFARMDSIDFRSQNSESYAPYHIWDPKPLYVRTETNVFERGFSTLTNFHLDKALDRPYTGMDDDDDIPPVAMAVQGDNAPSNTYRPPPAAPKLQREKSRTRPIKRPIRQRPFESILLVDGDMECLLRHFVYDLRRMYGFPPVGLVSLMRSTAAKIIGIEIADERRLSATFQQMKPRAKPFIGKVSPFALCAAVVVTYGVSHTNLAVVCVGGGTMRMAAFCLPLTTFDEGLEMQLTMESSREGRPVPPPVHKPEPQLIQASIKHISARHSLIVSFPSPLSSSHSPQDPQSVIISSSLSSSASSDAMFASAEDEYEDENDAPSVTPEALLNDDFTLAAAMFRARPVNFLPGENPVTTPVVSPGLSRAASKRQAYSRKMAFLPSEFQKSSSVVVPEQLTRKPLPDFSSQVRRTSVAAATLSPEVQSMLGVQNVIRRGSQLGSQTMEAQNLHHARPQRRRTSLSGFSSSQEKLSLSIPWDVPSRERPVQAFRHTLSTACDLDTQTAPKSSCIRSLNVHERRRSSILSKLKGVTSRMRLNSGS